ncbi:MAG: DUF945 family protein [Oligoflexia bacterium]|nr:DUF945 family protein [Oligoflexia bacterium]MBF0366085.1 DUF945 family protein [Oligoflexia bacterium]
MSLEEQKSNSDSSPSNKLLAFLKRKKRPIIVTVVGVLLLFIVVWPIVTGKIIERRFASVIEKLQQSLEENAVVESKFKYGLLSSEANVEIKLKKSDVTTLPSIILNTKTSNWSLSAKSVISFDREFTLQYFGEVEKSPEIKIKSCFGLLGTIYNDFEADPLLFKSVSKENGSTNLADLNGLKGKIHFNKNFGLNHLKLELQQAIISRKTSAAVAVAAIVAAPTEDKINKVEGDSNNSSEKDKDIKAEGKESVVIADAKTGITPGQQVGVVSAKDESAVEIKDVTYKLMGFSLLAKIKGKEKTFDGELLMSMEKYIGTDGREWGPGTIELASKNVASELLEEFRKMLGDMKSYDGNQDGGEDFKVKMLGRSMIILPALVKHSPTIEIKTLSLKTDKGEVLANGKFSIAESTGGFLAFLSNMNLLLDFQGPEALMLDVFERYYALSKQLKNGSKMSNSDEQESFLQEAQGLLETSYKDKYLIKKDSSVSFKFEYKDSSMKLNGEPFYFPGKK